MAACKLVRVLVVGAGVTGLTVGVRLAEHGYDVQVLARELPLETTSAVAAALWYPYRISPPDRALGWARRSLEVLTGLAGLADAGVVLREGVELLGEATPDPWWISAVPALRRVGDLPAPYRDGWAFTAPVVEMPVYLRWLQARLEGLGGGLTRMALPALPDHADVVVNCSGLGSRLLAHDDLLAPVRGQVLRLEQVGLERWLLDGAAPTYVVPRSHDIVVGGSDDEGDWDVKPDRRAAEDILQRATVLVPQLAGARVLGHRVGLRPGRPSVRLDAERTPTGGLVVHCYGHGGAGVTVSWGCADEVLGLVQASAPH